MSTSGKLEFIQRLLELNLITPSDVISLLGKDNHYGPSLSFQGEDYYLIDNKYLTESEYKNLLFQRDMKDLLDV